MMMFSLAMIGGIIVVGIVANHYKNKNDKEYGEYLAQLETVKERKRKRNGT